jgi:hypothetical protein
VKSARHPGFDAAHCPYGPPGIGVVVAAGMGARMGGGVGAGVKAGVKAGVVAMGVAISPSRLLVRPDKLVYSNHYSQQISLLSSSFPGRATDKRGVTPQKKARSKNGSAFLKSRRGRMMDWLSEFNLCSTDDHLKESNDEVRSDFDMPVVRCHDPVHFCPLPSRSGHRHHIL